MTANDAAPPRRSTHTWGTPGNHWIYDHWGTGGRPVVLLHSLLFDRRVWWPVAADLATHCTVIAPDLPGHGDTPTRAILAPAQLAAEIADLVHSLELRRAPIVVGHGTSAHIAAAFASSYATHALVTADKLDPCRVTTAEQFLAEVRPDLVPSVYRPYAIPHPGPALFRAYQAGHADAAAPLLPAGLPHVVVTSDCVAVLAGEAGARDPRFPAAARLPQLNDPGRFAADLRALLQPH